MNITQLKPSTRNADSLVITQNMILHIVPELGTKVIDYLYDLKLNINACHSLVIKNGMLNMGGKTFNATKIYLDSKSFLLDDKEGQSIKIVKGLPKSSTTLPKNKYLIIDHSITSQATEFISNVTTVKRGVIYLFDQLQRQYTFAKTRMSNFSNMVIIVIDPFKNITSDNKIRSNIDIINKLRIIDTSKINLQCFDTYICAALKINKNGKFNIVPIANFDNHNNVFLNKPNILYITKQFKTIQEDLIETPTIAIKQSEETKYNKEIKQLANTVEIKDNEYTINKIKFNKVISKFDIKDPIIANHIKDHIISYLQEHKLVIDENNLQHEILTAINKLVHGHDNINQKYIDNPAELFAKLQNLNNYKKSITYPPSKIMPIYGNLNKVIDLKYVTAPIKKEVEFQQNIHRTVKQLFKIIETQSEYPIKVKKIIPKVKDNNLNRYIDYTVTLQNISGGSKEPYDVHLFVPTLINDKYFKLNGKNYILSNQLFFKPLTKTTTDECRLLSNYAIVTLKIVNMRFNLHEFDNIIKYIQIKKPKLIKDIKTKNDKIISVSFNDKNQTTIAPLDEIILMSNTEAMVTNESNSYHIIKDNSITNCQIGKYEYLFDKIVEIIGKDISQITNKRIPYLRLHIGGIKIPLIMYLWSQVGLLNTLQKCHIDYTIGEVPEHDNVIYALNIMNSKEKVYMYSDQRRKKLIVNGLAFLGKFTVTKEDLNNRSSLDDFINNKYGTRAINNLNLLTLNEIDPITKELLKHENYPTDMVNLTSTSMVDILLNKHPTALTDLSNYRVRQSEIMFNLMYKQISQAHSYYAQEVAHGNSDAKLFLTKEYIIQCMLGVHQHTRGNSVLTSTSPFNPIAELKDDTKLIKTGPTGVPSKRAFKNSHRNIHESNIGNISANSTSESSDVGLVTHHSLTALMNNQFGIYGMRNIDQLNGWDVVAADEAIVPFINQIDPQRSILAITHQAQVIPITNPEVPFVSTGFNYALPHLSSKKFAYTAKKSGKVIDCIDDEFCKIEYDDGGIYIIDLTPRLSRNKRGTHINIQLQSLKNGDTFEKGQLIAWSNQFNKEHECYVSGKNVKIALMNYFGHSYEDGYVVTEKFSKESKTEILKELVIIVPYNAKINTLITEHKEVQDGDVLVDFSYVETIDNYLENFSILSTESGQEDINVYNTTGKSMQLKAIDGEIVHIKIYLNSKVNVDNGIIKKWNEITKQLKNKKSKLQSQYKITDEKIHALDNIDNSQLKIGGHKHNGYLFEGVKIVYYIKHNKPLKLGDKLSNRFGAKGVITKIVNEHENGIAEFSGDLDIYLSPASIMGRKNMAIIKELYMGKIAYFLREKLSEKASNKTPIIELKNLIIDIYSALDPTENQKYTNSIKNTINSLTDIQLRKKLKDKTIGLIFIVQPFENISFKQIKKAADILEIPLEEKVHFPHLGITSKHPVPVGFHYIQALEQTAEDYMSIRSTGKYISVTGQPAKGKKNFGGQSLGELDIQSMISFHNKNIMKELLGARSDNVSTNRNMINSIIQNGKASLPINVKKGKTHHLFNTLMIGMGLNIHK